MKTRFGATFRTRIFLTVALVALLPIIVCELLMLPYLTARSERLQHARAQAQLQGAQGAFEGVLQAFAQSAEAFMCDAAALAALEHNTEAAPALYEALYALSSACGGHARPALYSDRGEKLFCTGGASAPETLAPDWGALRACREKGGTALAMDEEGEQLIFAHPLGGAGYLVLAMTKSDFAALTGEMIDASYRLTLLDAFYRPLLDAPSGEYDALRARLLSAKAMSDARGAMMYDILREPISGCYLLLGQARLITGDVLRAYYAIAAVTGAVCLLLCLLGAWVLSRSLSRPVRALSQGMENVRRGDYSVRLPVPAGDEMARLCQGFNQMMNEYQENLERSVKRQRELNETQLRMMQAQLNPHFLYNTLDTVKWLGITHNVPQVAMLAGDLAGILRASITGNELIPLQEELALVEKYIDIQSLRYQDRFTCELDVAERFQRCVVPKLVLQPLVENAVTHGVSDREDGYIKVWAEEEIGELVLHVSDNGRGMPKDVLERLQDKSRPVEGGHLGLHHVDSILRLHFGQRYGVSAVSEPGRGSVVSVRLPLRRMERKHHDERAGG